MDEDIEKKDEFKWGAFLPPINGQNWMQTNESTTTSSSYEDYEKLAKNYLKNSFEHSTSPIQSQYNWNSEYNRLVNNIPNKVLKKYNRILNSSPKYKEKLTIKESMCAFRELRDKDINEFILTGSVALFLQDKITRTVFKDIDLISLSDYEMDDDMQNCPIYSYDQIEGNGEQKQIVFNGVLFDIFSFGPEKKIDTVEVKYGKETYLCQDYKQIIMAKLRMILPKMKDSEELFKNCMEINFK